MSEVSCAREALEGVAELAGGAGDEDHAWWAKEALSADDADGRR
jgi:hypothetical protein